MINMTPDLAELDTPDRVTVHLLQAREQLQEAQRLSGGRLGVTLKLQYKHSSEPMPREQVMILGAFRRWLNHGRS